MTLEIQHKPQQRQLHETATEGRSGLPCGEIDCALNSPAIAILLPPTNGGVSYTLAPSGTDQLALPLRPLTTALSIPGTLHEHDDANARYLDSYAVEDGLESDASKCPNILYQLHHADSPAMAISSAPPPRLPSKNWISIKRYPPLDSNFSRFPRRSNMRMPVPAVCCGRNG